ncbi:hypothetical protein [Thioalkalivibrio sp. ARh3]|uniref:hypothetical protein n=1 Tax=Thioalkalivibrio sp. ARh3 TaxID=1158148 RepID=UPI0012DC011F|nr:hypothetical protein [Thioalkalivibrio sp. ARh3]
MKDTREYRLTGGRRVTVGDVAREAGITRECARSRLRSSRDPSVVFAKPRPSVPVYELSDGTRGTSAQLAKMAGISQGQMTVRLRESRNAEEVLRGNRHKLRDFGWHLPDHRLQLDGTPSFDDEVRA